jgi:hypothetical protein
MKAKKKKQKRKKTERKQKKEQKRKERNAELRRRTKAREIAYYDNEAEYYLEERDYLEEQYDDEQNAITTTRNTSRKCFTISASDCTRGANQPGHQKAQQMGEGNAATKEAKGRTSDGGLDHHLRDGATARAKEEERQEEEGDNETQPHHRMDPGMADDDYAT